MVRNKARLVAQGYTLKEGMDYDEVFAPVVRIEAIRLFLAYASFKDFVVNQMDVKSAFLYSKIEEETASTPMETSKPLLKDENAKDVDVHLYRSMIGSLMYLTSSRPDIMFAVCACARFQVTPKVSHLHDVKRIFRYLKDRKSTKRGCQFLGSRLISWQCKKQTVVADFTTEAEYVDASNCCGQAINLISIQSRFSVMSLEQRQAQNNDKGFIDSGCSRHVLLLLKGSNTEPFVLSKPSDLDATKFSYCCFIMVFCIFLDSLLPLNMVIIASHKVYEAEIKGQSSSSLNSQNVAFVSSDNTSSTNEAVNTVHSVFAASSQGQASTSTYADDVMFSFFSNQSNSSQLDNEDLEQMDTDDLVTLLENAGYQEVKGTKMETIQEGLYQWRLLLIPWLLLMGWVMIRAIKIKKDLQTLPKWPFYLQVYPVQLLRNFVPTAVIKNSGKVPVNAAKQSSLRVAASASIARYVNTAANRPTVNECLVLSPDFKLPNENQVLLKVPRQNKRKAAQSLLTPNLDFMKPFGCPVTILNTLDHIGKFDRKADKGFLVGYFVNSKAFRVFNSRTRRVEENLHIKFQENKPNVAGRDDKDAGDVLDKGDQCVRKGSGIDDQEKTDSGTQNVGTTEPSINTASTNVNTEVGAEVDINNLELSTVVSHILTTRVDKDHPKERIIRDLNLATQTRRILSFSKENAIVSCINKQRRTNHKDYQNCLFACFLSQQESKKDRDDILLVQVYVDNIIFGSAKKSLCGEFKQIMHKRFQMSSMRELTFFLGLQVKQKDDGIFISQDKYVADILKKFDFTTVKTTSTLMEPNKTLIKDAKAEDVDVHLYRLMIGSLMYLTASKPGIMFTVYACARFQVTPKTSHLHVVKRIFRYLKVFDSKTKHIEIRHHFIRDSYEKKLIQVIKIHIDHNVADLLTKAFNVKTVNDDVLIQALVDGKKVVVNEASIRRDLRLDDAAGTACLPNAAIFEEWGIFFNPSLTKKVFANTKRVGTGFSEKKHKPRRKQRMETKVSQDELPTEDHIPTPSHDPLPSGEDRLQLNELMEICTKLSDKEDAFKPGRIAEIDVDEDLSLINETTQDQGRINDQDLFRLHYLNGDEVFVDVTTGENLEQDLITLMDIKAAKPKAKGVTIQEPSEFKPTSLSQPPQAKDKGKGIMVEPGKPLKKKDQITLDKEVVRKLEDEIKAKMDEEERVAREKNEANIAVIEE
uniref:Uncharacterized mitochondrial protein AtMg00810-like n=1 Tax=Tanacetum cinerariifolium TaxID=118510 RepID=A0A6L2KHA1_TANCI|nr:uncharacterized mitochondrial protein AtMg00810-like [Tanacetum cinerariifolium]